MQTKQEVHNAEKDRHAPPFLAFPCFAFTNQGFPEIAWCGTLSLGQNFLEADFFLITDILLKLKQQILICSCKFSCNSEIVMGLLRLLK